MVSKILAKLSKKNKNCDVCAIVVTFNRQRMLRENLSALLSQSRDCDIIVIDNASTDGTSDYVRGIAQSNPRVTYINTERNRGGSYGFSLGLACAFNMGYSYSWLMDDDAIPTRNALESLIHKSNEIENQFSFLAGVVRWTDGRLFPMNIPCFSQNANLHIDTIRQHNLCLIDSCSFVGCFVNMAVALNTALPVADFFIYGDDVEYTQRLRKLAPAYLDLDCELVHKAPSIAGSDITFSSDDRIDRFYHQSRNGVYIAKQNGINGVVKRLCLILKRSASILKNSKSRKIKRLTVLWKGTIAGLFFDPELVYPSDCINI